LKCPQLPLAVGQRVQRSSPFLRLAICKRVQLDSAHGSALQLQTQLGDALLCR
jgi:hypothetical protein